MAELAPVREIIKDHAGNIYLILWIEDNILYGRYADNLHLSLDIARYVVTERLKFCRYKDYLGFIDVRGIRSASKEAREYLANEGSEGIIAGALLIDSILTRTLGNIFLMINKPKMPSKLFTSEDEAIAWLKGFNKELN